VNLSLISASVLAFMCIFKTNIGGQVLSWFAPAGRMTLTFYIAQSVVFVPLYYGFGLAWYASMGQLWSLVLGILFWLMQMFIAAYYMRHLRYGPLEWLWRKATFY